MNRPYVTYLGLSDLLEAIEKVTGLGEDEILTEDVIERGRRALDAPAAERRGGAENRELFPSFVEKAAVMCERLLADPPIREEAAKVAFQCLQQFLVYNSASWQEAAAKTIIRFEGFTRAPSRDGALRDWIEARVGEVPPSFSRGTGQQPELFAHSQRPSTVVLLCGSPQRTPPEVEGEIESLAAEIEAALDAAAAKTYEPCEMRLEHPGTRVAELVDAEAVDGHRQEWEYTSRLVIEQVDAMIVVDTLLEHAGLGAVSEFDLHVAQDGPILYLHRAGSVPSRLLSGRADEVDIDIVPYRDRTEIAAIVRDWAVKCWPSIRTATRRRTDRLIQYTPVRRRIERAWKRSDSEQRELAADAAGMTLQAVNRALTSTAFVAVMPAHRLDALCSTLGVATPRAPGRQLRAPNRDNGPNYAALLQAADEYGWPRSTIIALFRDVSATPRRGQHVSRSGLQEKEDWVRRRNDLDA